MMRSGVEGRRRATYYCPLASSHTSHWHSGSKKTVMKRKWVSSCHQSVGQRERRELSSTSHRKLAVPLQLSVLCSQPDVWIAGRHDPSASLQGDHERCLGKRQPVRTCLLTQKLRQLQGWACRDRLSAACEKLGSSNRWHHAQSTLRHPVIEFLSCKTS